jgi:FAD/FMN-containing dehydrogenase
MHEIAHRSLRPEIDRDVLAWPGDDRYETARQPYNLSMDQRPNFVALPRNAEDVVGVVRFAADIGACVAPQRTGHAATAVGPLDGALLLRTDRMRAVQLDVDRRRVRVAAGVQWQDVVPAASKVGLAALHGTASDVGVVGYTLGGGLSWYARKHGLAVNRVTAIEVVTADGRLRRVDHNNEPDLFWALRGGGGNFGVVTALEFDLVPAPELYAGALFFPLERSAEVLHAWRAWVAEVPDEMMSVGRILRIPPAPEVPEPLRGRAFALVEAVHLGSEAVGKELLEPLRRLGPVIDTVGPARPVDLAGLHMDPPDPLPYDGVHQLLEYLPAKAIDEIVRLAGPDSDSPLASFELRHLGGALQRREPGQGALGVVPGSFATFAVGVTPDAAARGAVREHLDVLRGSLQPYELGYEFPNFAMRPTEPSRLFGQTTAARLRRVRAELDPHRLFIAKHAI